MPGKERIQHFLTIAKVCRLQAHQGRSKVDQPPPCRAVKQAERADNGQTLRKRGVAAATVIDQDEVGAQRHRQRDRRALSVIERRQQQFLKGRGRRDLKPSWPTGNPTSYHGWRARVAEFRSHHLGCEHRAEQPGEEVDLSDEHQVVERTGIGDDPHATSEAEAVERLLLSLDVDQRVGLEHAVLLEEAIQLGAYLEAEQAA